MHGRTFKSVEKKNTFQLQNAPNISTLYAYEFEHEITVTTTSWKMIRLVQMTFHTQFHFKHVFRLRVYCRYLDKNENEIGDPFESFTYPEYIVSCPKREGTKRIGLSVTPNAEFIPLPLVDRMLKSEYRKLDNFSWANTYRAQIRVVNVRCYTLWFRSKMASFYRNDRTFQTAGNTFQGL